MPRFAPWQLPILLVTAALGAVSLLPWFRSTNGLGTHGFPNAWAASPLWALVPLLAVVGGVSLWWRRPVALTLVGTALGLWAVQAVRYRSVDVWGAADADHCSTPDALAPSTLAPSNRIVVNWFCGYGTASDSGPAGPEPGVVVRLTGQPLRQIVHNLSPDAWSPSSGAQPADMLANASMSVCAYVGGLLLLLLFLLVAVHRRPSGAVQQPPHE